MRAVTIIRRLCGASIADAEQCLLRSIYETNDLSFVDRERAFPKALGEEEGEGEAAVHPDSDVIERHLAAVRERAERGSAVPLAVLLFLSERAKASRSEREEGRERERERERTPIVTVEEAEGVLRERGGIKQALQALLTQ